MELKEYLASISLITGDLRTSWYVEVLAANIDDAKLEAKKEFIHKMKYSPIVRRKTGISGFDPALIIVVDDVTEM